MSKLLGIEIKRGVFKNTAGQEISYNNLVLHFSSDTLAIETDEKGNVIRYGIGAKAETIKIRNTPENLKQVFGVVPGEKLFREMIGQDINIYCNQYGTVIQVLFPNANKKA